MGVESHRRLFERISKEDGILMGAGLLDEVTILCSYFSVENIPFRLAYGVPER